MTLFADSLHIVDPIDFGGAACKGNDISKCGHAQPSTIKTPAWYGVDINTEVISKALRPYKWSDQNQNRGQNG